MKKLVLGLMLVMGLSLVGCGSTESKNEVVNGGGVAIEKPVEVETEVETEEEVVVGLEMSIEEMKEYYNDNQFVGTPRVEKCELIEFGGRMLIWTMDTTTLYFDTVEGVEVGQDYYFIIVDNGTPDDIYDDEVAYIFTTPIE